ncbi:siderophore-iron reductase FhuF [Martelella alba]|nr:siderophore-iron reductase FhuF [Martelella alba]
MKSVEGYNAPAAKITEDFLLAPPVGTEVHSAALLCSPDTALPLLAPLMALYQGEDRAAVVSMWSQWYFALLLAPWIRVNMLYNWQLPILPRDIGFTLSKDAVPEQFILAHAGRPAPCENGQVRFAELLTIHLSPVCQTFATLSGIKPGLFWNNAGIRLAHGLSMAREAGADTASADGFLQTHTLSDGSVNPVYRPMRVISSPSGPPTIIRRRCCLRYKISGLEYCPSCPLLEADRRKAERSR